jgi:hypothetical protein
MAVGAETSKESRIVWICLSMFGFRHFSEVSKYSFSREEGLFPDRRILSA